MTSAILAGGTRRGRRPRRRAARKRPEVRPALSPVVVAKYLASRDTPAKLKRFRQVRRQLREASAYAAEAHDRRAAACSTPG